VLLRGEKREKKSYHIFWLTGEKGEGQQKKKSDMVLHEKGVKEAHPANGKTKVIAAPT